MYESSTSQKNSLPRREQYQEIHEKSSELFMLSLLSLDDDDSLSMS